MMSVRSVRLVAVAGVLAMGLASCHAESAASSATPATVSARVVAAALHEPTEDGLKAAATAYANAFLAGSYRALIGVLDPACVPKGTAALNARVALGDNELQHFQTVVRQHTGVDASKIAIRTVAVRNYQGKTGDAEAHYGLAAAIEGNDNWNSYAFSGGQWHIDGCDLKFPMGGQDSSKSATAQP